MAIPTPTIPSAQDTVSAVALKTTQNNKAFYINSGLIAVNNVETTVISVNDIGKRDILFCINPILTSAGSDDIEMKVKNNGSIIYQSLYGDNQQNHIPYAVHLIIPANTNIEITFKNTIGASSHDCGVSAYGYFMEG
jgi:hypothetical protein